MWRFDAFRIHVFYGILFFFFYFSEWLLSLIQIRQCMVFCLFPNCIYFNYLSYSSKQCVSFGLIIFTAVNDDPQSWKHQVCVDIEKLENEYVLTSAEYLLSLANVKLPFAGNFFLFFSFSLFYCHFNYWSSILSVTGLMKLRNKVH